MIKVGRLAPVTQVCSACGHLDGLKPLDVREWACPACGIRHDGDHNAAKNMRVAAGPAASACGPPIRPVPDLVQRDETGSHGFPPECCAA
ncbi:zinc ribbon domain-containing protein [Streptomyces sp. NBC_00649]|uniref:zinc ribbon domain-containing protein n=1 Tax=Streptomyces sp. NBC_00649 TaxID=2975798 RepID=UPI00386CB3B2